MKNRTCWFALSTLLLGGCSLFEPKVSALDDEGAPSALTDLSNPADTPLVWRAAILKQCAVDVEGLKRVEAAPVVAALGEIVLSKLIDFGVSAFAASVNEAAKLDKEGMTFSATGGDYLYTSTVGWKGGLTAEPTEPVVTSRAEGCLVVARGRARYADSPLADWCTDSAQEPCAGKRVKHFEAVAKALDLNAPSFYTEIRLLPATSRDAIKGELSYLYYPKFLTDRGQSTRDLLITASLLNPSATPSAGTAVSVYSFALKDLHPPVHIMGSSSLGTAVAGWSPLPAPPSKETLVALARSKQLASKMPPEGESQFPSADESLDFSGQAVPGQAGALAPTWSVSFANTPVSLVASVQETGDVNRFLQYMAAWLATDAAQQAIATPIKNALLPSKQEEAAAAEATAAAQLRTAFDTAIDGYLAVSKAYQAFCEQHEGTLTGSASTEEQTLHLAVVRAVGKVSLAAASVNVDMASYAVTVAQPAPRCGRP